MHKGEIAFPGGALSKQDKSLCDTATRETREEIGLIIEQKDILGSLQSVQTLTSNFCIIPFVTLQDKILEPQILFNEVQDVIDAPLFDLLDTLKIDQEHQGLSTKSLYNTKLILSWMVSPRKYVWQYELYKSLQRLRPTVLEIHMTLLLIVAIIIMREQIHVLVPSGDAGMERSNSFFFFLLCDI
jgi:hypothetical protein